MKKFLGLMVLLVFLLLSLTACLNPSLPYGIWQSEDLNMTLFIDEELIISGDGEWSGTFPGVYMQDYEEVDIIIHLDWKGGNIILEFGGGNSIFHGSYRIVDNRLDIREHPPRDGYGRRIEVEPRTIVFDLIGEVTD